MITEHDNDSTVLIDTSIKDNISPYNLTEDDETRPKACVIAMLRFLAVCYFITLFIFIEKRC
jgi:hypothetical protein